jgi:ATP synthase subunit 6
MTNITTFFTSPLEQFGTDPILVPCYSGFFSLGFTNLCAVVVSIFLLFYFFIHSVNSRGHPDFWVASPSWQGFYEELNLLAFSFVMDNIKDKSAQSFIPFLYCLFLCVLSLNFVGLIPYSFTLTSHIVLTFAVGLVIFTALNIIGIKKNGFRYFSLLLPSGTSIALSFLLIPIEFISYIFKPISLSIRLFANMMAGHTLLKVIAGFVYTLMSLGGFLFFVSYVPLLILVLLIALEVAVASIQTFVFGILICIYINDAITLH